MLTEMQRKALDLSQTLNDLYDNDEFVKMCEETYCEILLSEEDALSYNEPYYCDGYKSGQFNAHNYFKFLQRVGDAVVLRVMMIAHHYELLDSCKYSVIGNMTEHEIENLMRMEEDVDVNEKFNYEDYLEVAQVWFFPTGEIVELVRQNVSGDYAPHTNWCDIDDPGRFADTLLPIENGMREDRLDYSGGWIAGSPLMPVAEGTDIHEVFRSGVDVCDDLLTAMFDPEATMAVAFDIFHKFIRQYDPDKDFLEMGKMDDAIAITLHHWGYDALWSMFISQGLASAAAKYYHTIKIAHRNGFDASAPERQRKWMQLLENINFCNGNIEDPRNYMPVDFDRMFAYWDERVRNKKRLMAIEAERLRKEEEERRRLNDIERTKKEDIDYQERRGLMRSIVIGNDKMYARVIQDVTEFYEEGKEQGFCIYNCNYFRFPEWLCFTVRDVKTHKRLSTVTYDMKNEIIEANLTKGDQVPEMFDEIEELIMAHKEQIRRDWERCPDFVRPSDFWLEAQREAHSWNLDHRLEEAEQKQAILARRAKAAQTAAAKQQTIVISHAI